MIDLVLGIDVGTSGVRVAAIDHAGYVAAFATSTMPAAQRDGTRITQDPALWARALDDAMAGLGSTVDLARIGALAVDGTSGTLVAVDELGRPVAAGSLYNDSADAAAVAAVGRVAPARAAVHGTTSPLARATRLQRTAGVARIIHQADWIAGQFSGRFDVSDESNALKTARNCPRSFRPAPPSEKLLPRPRAGLACQPARSWLPARRTDAQPFSRRAPTNPAKPLPRSGRRWSLNS